ncbi:MAG: porin [Alphaproteobacteria bacterium]|nr:porin [Alphaproteobacteria bacterium]
MKKLLLASVAVSGLALASAPAYADIDLDVGGYFKGYGVFVDQDETAGTSVNDFDIIRDTELHISGETTLDNGLTVGAHFELDVDGADNTATDESYAYFSGNWGRVNVGAEDGAGYLLQVAAPSADSNVDGIRQYVQPFNATGNIGTGVQGLDYDMDPTGKDDKLTYLSPIVNGFQAGVTYTPDSNATTGGAADDLEGAGTETTTDGVGDEAYELAVRYEGQFDQVGVIAGAGFAHVENNSATATQDDRDAWNVGLDLDVSAFGIGAAYMEDSTFVDNADVETLVVGGDYTTGPFKIGVSYLNQDSDAAASSEYDRYTGGVVYEYGPGMSFRGSLQFTDVDNSTTDADGTAVILGTQVNF